MRTSSPLAALIVAPIAALCFQLNTAEATPAYKCHEKTRPKNVQIGVRGDYEVKDGLELKAFSGFLKRTKAKPKNGCFFPKLTSGQCVVMQFDIKGYDSASVRGQCVLSETGKKFTRAGRPNRRGPIRGSHMLTKCPNKTGYKCDAGHNSHRADTFDKALKKQGKMLWSYCAGGATNDLDKNIGKKVFCQLYDRKTNTVLFATEFTYTR